MLKLPGHRIGTTVDPSVSHLTARQFVGDAYDDREFPFWYTKTGIIVKWSLFLGLLILITAYLLIGYTHAKKRIARGQVPLAYHRWLVSRQQLSRVDPRYAYPAPAGYSTYRPPQQNDYGMYAMPPPSYDPTAPRPPMYYGPPPTEGQQNGVQQTKVDPDQTRGGYQQPTVTEEYEAPAGPPPASAVKPHGTGNSNPFRG